MPSIFDRELLDLGNEANRIKTKMWGHKVFYVNNLHINYTNMCLSACKFCAFSKRIGEKDGYFMQIPDVIEYVNKNGTDAKELHIVGGLHPDADFSYYLDMISSLSKEFPEKAIKAFSAVEIDYMSNQSGKPLDVIFKQLKDAGLDMLPGGGAEILSDNVRDQICPEKISGNRWLEIMESAHSNGVKTNATMLYGHLENGEDREAHLISIRKLQEKTNGFNAFIPLSFQPDNTFLSNIPQSTGVDDLKVIAASRIILDNIPHIKAYWVMLGEKTAQIALNFGADDLDGTIVKENISHAAGNKTRRGMTEEDLKALVISAGLTPVERDAFYNAVVK